MVKVTTGRERAVAPQRGVGLLLGRSGVRTDCPQDTGLLYPSVWDVALPGRFGAEASTPGPLDFLCSLL